MSPFKLNERGYPLTRPRFSFDASPAAEELERLGRRLATGEHTAEDLDRLRELPREDHEELKRLVARERESEDRRRNARDGEREASEHREFNPAITPLTAEEARHAMDAARREVLAAGVPAALAMDHANSPEGVYAAGVRALGGSCAGHPSSTWPQMFRTMVARGGRGFFDRFPGARNVRVADYNDLGGR